MQNNNQGISSRALGQRSWSEIASFSNSSNNKQVEVKLTVQPVSSFRFRYESENSMSPIRGSGKKFPTIKIENFEGKAAVRVSCVTKDEPYKPHPNELKNNDKPTDGKDNETGVYKFEYQVKSDSREYEIVNLRLVYVKKGDFEHSFKRRQKEGVDPFNTGFSHAKKAKEAYEAKKKDRDAFRLCFEVFFPENQFVQVTPIVSNVIQNIEAFSTPEIKKQYPGSASVTGGTKIVLMCNKVEEDHEVVFYLEDKNGVEVWADKATEVFVHQSNCILLTVPPYRDLKITENISVHIQVRKPGGETRSRPIPFEYICIPRGIQKLQEQVADLLKLCEGDTTTPQNVMPSSLSGLENNTTPPQNVMPPSLSGLENNATTSQSFMSGVLENNVTTSQSFLSGLLENNSTAIRKNISPILQDYELSDMSVEQSSYSVEQMSDEELSRYII